MSGKSKLLIVAVVLLTVMMFVAYQFIVQINLLSNVKAQDAALNQQLNTATAQTEQYKKDIADSKTDSWVERMARDLLGWVKPGDVKIVDKGK